MLATQLSDEALESYTAAGAVAPGGCRPRV